MVAHTLPWLPFLGGPLGKCDALTFMPEAPSMRPVFHTRLPRRVRGVAEAQPAPSRTLVHHGAPSAGDRRQEPMSRRGSAREFFMEIQPKHNVSKTSKLGELGTCFLLLRCLHPMDAEKTCILGLGMPAPTVGAQWWSLESPGPHEILEGRMSTCRGLCVGVAETPERGCPPAAAPSVLETHPSLRTTHRDPTEK